MASLEMLSPCLRRIAYSFVAISFRFVKASYSFSPHSKWEYSYLEAPVAKPSMFWMMCCSSWISVHLVVESFATA